MAKRKKGKPIPRTPEQRYYTINGKKKRLFVWKDARGKVHKTKHAPRNKSSTSDYIRSVGRMGKVGKKRGKTTYYVRGEGRKISLGIERELTGRDKINVELNTIDVAAIQLTHETPAGNKISGKITPKGPELEETVKIRRDTTLTLRERATGISGNLTHKKRKIDFL